MKKLILLVAGIMLFLEFPIVSLSILVVVFIIVSLKTKEKDNYSHSNTDCNKKEAINIDTESKDSFQESDDLSKIICLPQKSDSEQGYYLFLDTETTGFPINSGASTKKFDNWPYIVEIAWILTDKSGNLVNSRRYIVKQNTTIPREASKIHKITNTIMKREGITPEKVYRELVDDINRCSYIIGHNLKYDLPIIQCDLNRNNIDFDLYSKDTFCTMMSGMKFTSKELCGKFPKLVELFGLLYFNDVDIEIKGTHSALIDTILTYRCFMEMIKRDPEIVSEKYKVSRTKGDMYLTREKKLSGDVLKKDLTNADPGSMFYDKKIVITGEFPIKRADLADILKTDMGADIDVSIGKFTEFLLVGDDPGQKKLEKAREKGIKIITKDIVMEEVAKYH